MVRDERVPFECAGDPKGIFSTRGKAEAFKAEHGTEGWTVSEWTIDEAAR